MSRRAQTCTAPGCLEHRVSWSVHRMCARHEDQEDQGLREEYEASPKGRALKALEECKNGVDLKEFIREHLIEAML